MPSPYPGMDPYIEGHVWQDFHGSLIFAIRDLLVPMVRPRYFVRTEERVYLDHDVANGQPRHVRPDLLVAARQAAGAPSGRVAAATATIDPVTITLPMPEEVRERYLTIRDSDTRDVVTVIEVLSPTNKRAGSYDRAVYVAKRDEVLLSGTSLVEIDLLRGGLRLPADEALPEGDYYAIVSRGSQRPRAEAYAWTIRQPLPTIPAPLAPGDDDVRLDLQAAFTTAYDHAGYDYSLDYSHPIDPALGSVDREWAAGVLAASSA